MDAGFQPEQVHAVRAGVVGQMIQDQLAEPAAAKLRANVHPLDFADPVLERLQCAARHGPVVDEADEEFDAGLHGIGDVPLAFDAGELPLLLLPEPDDHRITVMPRLDQHAVRIE